MNIINRPTPFVGKCYPGEPVVPISVFVFLFKTGKLREPPLKIRVINGLGNFLQEAGPGLGVQVLPARQVGTEAGEGLPGRTDRDLGETKAEIQSYKPQLGARQCRRWSISKQFYCW